MLYWGYRGTIISRDAFTHFLADDTSHERYGVGDEIKFELLLDQNPNVLRIFKNGNQQKEISQMIQTQKWYLMRFTGNDEEINIKTKHPEFLEWKWVELDQITDLVVKFKLELYKEVKDKVKKILN